MKMQMFTAEASLYRASSYYALATGSYNAAFNHVIAAQPALPNCGSGNFTNCVPGMLPNCPTNCVQRCIDITGTAPIVKQECCPADKCGQPSGDCCKKVCCEVKVS